MRCLDGITELNGHEFEQAKGVGDGQGGLAYCSPWGGKVSDTTELNWTECSDILRTNLMAESEEELKSLLTKVKEESEKAGLKLNIQKMKIVAPGLITLWQIDG